MSELEDFLSEAIELHAEAVDAFHDGDSEPYEALWSRSDPVTLFPPEGPGKSGWDAVQQNLREVASHFSNASESSIELIAADVSGDLAYTVAWERASAAWDDGPVEPTHLRVTHMYRREEGAWKIVHRHGGGGPSSDHLVGIRNDYGKLARARRP